MNTLINGSIVHGVAKCAAIFCIFGGAHLVPPRQFDHQPRLMPIIAHVHLLEMNFACQMHVGIKYVPGQSRTQACSFMDEIAGHCLIFLPYEEDVGPIVEKALWRHERAHCNGWKHQ